MMRLADLRVMVPPSDLNPRVPTRFVEATVADLIAALKEEGAEETMLQFKVGGPDLRPIPSHGPGRYLVFRIDDEGEK